MKTLFQMKTQTKKTNRYWWVSIFCICFFLISCEKLSPVVSEDFINAYIELRATSLELGDVDPNARIQRTKILKKYSFTTESFNQESERIRSKPELWLLFQQKVVDTLDSLPLNTPSENKK